MKTRMLFIALIGMITATTLASAPMLQQKQKATISKQWVTPVLVDVVEVQSDFLSFQNETTVVALGTKTFFAIKSIEPTNSFAVICDVGWQSPGQFRTDTFYKERLTIQYLPDHRMLISKLGIEPNI